MFVTENRFANRFAAPSIEGEDAGDPPAGGGSLLTEKSNEGEGDDPADPAGDGADPSVGDPADPADDGADPAGDPAGDDADGDAGEDDGDDDKPGAPEEYEAFEAPEGLTLDEEAIAEFAPVARELGLSQEQAQQLVSLQAQQAQKWADAYADHVTQTRVAWREAVQNDTEIGGDALTENLSVARKGLDTFGSTELRTLFDETGIGDHPEVVKLFYRLGKANSEHDFVISGKPEKQVSFYDHPTSSKRD